MAGLEGVVLAGGAPGTAAGGTGGVRSAAVGIGSSRWMTCWGVGGGAVVGTVGLAVARCGGGAAERACATRKLCGDILKGRSALARSVALMLRHGGVVVVRRWPMTYTCDTERAPLQSHWKRLSQHRQRIRHHNGRRLQLELF